MSDRGRSSSPSGRPGSTGPPGSPGGPASGMPASLGYDPGRDKPTERKENTRMELPADAYLPTGKRDLFPLRSGRFNTEGQKIDVEVNQYRLMSFDYSKKIYQYDVSVSPEPVKLAPVMRKIFAHKEFINHMKQFQGHTWLYDGKKLAWSATKLPRSETRFKVDLDEGRPPPNPSSGRPPRSNDFLVIIRETTVIDMSILRSFLENRVQFDTKVQEALNFMDHLLRQGPSLNRLAIKRNFYDEKGRAHQLIPGDNVEVHKGIYASIRLSQNLSTGGMGLALNADVANTCFWVGGKDLLSMIPQFLASCDEQRWGHVRPESLPEVLQPEKDGDRLKSSDAFKQLRKMRKLKFTTRYRGADKSQTYTIEDFLYDPKYGPGGATAVNVKFTYEGEQVSVRDYYRKRWQVHLKNPLVPLVDAGKQQYFPLECCVVKPMQRYPFKLNSAQTAAMIKVAVTRPAKRRQEIEEGVRGLGLANDNWLNYYGVKFEQKFTKTEAKLLKAPTVHFGRGTADPGFSGRWDLRGKTFAQQNRAPLKNWGFIAMNDCVDAPTMLQFARTFKQTFSSHGGLVQADPIMVQLPAGKKTNGAEAVNFAFQEIQQKTKGYPQILFIIVQHRNSPHYIRLKKSCDIRFGILSQVVNALAVKANSGQYHSNVCMKVNAKLGGGTSKTAPPWRLAQNTGYFSRPTMMIGGDVSHAAPGLNAPSVAAMTMSTDRLATRYAGLAETNGYRVEMMKTATIDFLFRNLLKHWKKEHGRPPEHIIYMRDGVDTGQFSAVLDYEVEGMKSVLKNMGVLNVQFTVIVATKRHHVRFFPTAGDKHGNAKPGTVVEREVTHPFLLDWYTCSHVAIQGTARPVHYHVLQDDANMDLNHLQKMLYHQCYSYARSTTPVSLHPAVYYAHLVSNRARAHERIATSEGFRAGGKGHELARDRVAKGIVSNGPGRRRDDSPPLMNLGGDMIGKEGSPLYDAEIRQRDFMKSTMWYM